MWPHYSVAAAQARALLQSGQLDLAMHTAKQAFEQQRTSELQQVCWLLLLLHLQCSLAVLHLHAFAC